MTEITRYLAFDGTEFENYYECKDYEDDLRRKELDLMMLDDHRHPTDDFEKTMFVFIKDEKTLDYFIEQMEDYGYPSPDKVGNYYWDNDVDRWRSIEGRVFELRSELANYETLLSLYA